MLWCNNVTFDDLISILEMLRNLDYEIRLHVSSEPKKKKMCAISAYSREDGMLWRGWQQLMPEDSEGLEWCGTYPQDLETEASLEAANRLVLLVQIATYLRCQKPFVDKKYHEELDDALYMADRAQIRLCDMCRDEKRDEEYDPWDEDLEMP